MLRSLSFFEKEEAKRGLQPDQISSMVSRLHDSIARLTSQRTREMKALNPAPSKEIITHIFLLLK